MTLKNVTKLLNLKKYNILRWHSKQLATVYNNNHRNRGCLPFVKITLPVCKSSWIQLEDEKVNSKSEARASQYLYIHLWVLSREEVWAPSMGCVWHSRGACTEVLQSVLVRWFWVWRILLSALCSSCININTAVLLSCPPRTDWGGLLKKKSIL